MDKENATEILADLVDFYIDNAKVDEIEKQRSKKEVDAMETFFRFSN